MMNEKANEEWEANEERQRQMIHEERESR